MREAGRGGCEFRCQFLPWPRRTKRIQQTEMAQIAADPRQTSTGRRCDGGGNYSAERVGFDV